MRLQRRGWLLLLCFAAAGAAVGAWWLWLRTPGPVETAVAAIAESSRVECFRLDGREDPDRPPAKPLDGLTLGGFAVTARGREQGRELAGELAATLADPALLNGRFMKCFWPGVGFRAWRGDRPTDVIICFFCDNLYCGPPLPSVRENGAFSGSPARPRLVRLVKKAFPDDPAIQALDERNPPFQSPSRKP